MFAGMTLCILLETHHRAQMQAQSSTKVTIVAIPALLDLLATACGTTGLLYTTVSVYQMLRGGMLVATAILSVLFLNAKLTRKNWGGIALCCLGICVVGYSNIYSEGNPQDSSNVRFGVLVILFGQILQAAQGVVEEYLLSNLNMSSIRVVAWEGLFGMLHCFVWVFPLVQILPGRDHGKMEDIIDAAYMTVHSSTIAIMIIADMGIMLLYNWCGMEVTNALSASHRVVMETLRTVAIWVADLFLFYVVTNGKFGEEWTNYSYVQIIGFLLLVAGSVMYNYDTLFVKEEKESEPLIEVKVEDAPAYKSIEPPEKTVIRETEPVAIPGYDGYSDHDDEDEEGDDNIVGSYRSTVGSAAHSSYMAAFAGTPTSGPRSFRQRHMMSP